MIRLDLIDHRGHHIKSVDLQKEEIKVGRALHCDLIIPSFDIEPEEILIKKTDKGYVFRHRGEEETLKGDHRIRLEGFKVQLTDLTYFAGEKQVVVTSRDWMYTLAFLAFVFALAIYDRWALTLTPVDGWKLFKEISEIFMVFCGAVVGLSVVSRALNGEYRIFKIANVVLLSAISVSLLVDGIFGFRWLLPSFFHIDQVWYLLYYLWAGLTLWSLSEVILDHVSRTIRLNIIGGLFLLLGIGYFSNFLTVREKYEYFAYFPKPPLPEVVESRPVNSDEFVNELEDLF